MSDRIISIAQVYMAAYSCDITVLAALFLGVGLGALVWYAEGKDRGYRDGYAQGESDGLGAGYQMGKERRRDAHGRFSK